LTFGRIVKLNVLCMICFLKRKENKTFFYASLFKNSKCIKYFHKAFTNQIDVMRTLIFIDWFYVSSLTFLFNFDCFFFRKIKIDECVFYRKSFSRKNAIKNPYITSKSMYSKISK
jgi:hypothetical protein